MRTFVVKIDDWASGGEKYFAWADRLPATVAAKLRVFGVGSADIHYDIVLRWLTNIGFVHQVAFPRRERALARMLSRMRDESGMRDEWTTIDHGLGICHVTFLFKNLVDAVYLKLLFDAWETHQ